MSRRRLEPAEPWPEEPKAPVPTYAPGGPVGFDPEEPAAEPDTPEEPNAAYYALTVSAEEALASVKLGTTVQEARAARAALEGRRDALDGQLAALEAEAEARVTERAAREADVERFASEGRVDDVQAAQIRINALDTTAAAREKVAARVRGQREKLVAEALPPAEKAIRDAEAAFDEWRGKHGHKTLRSMVDYVIKAQLRAWLKDPKNIGSLAPDHDGVMFARAVTTLPDIVAREAAADPLAFATKVNALATPTPEPRPSKEEALRSIARLREVVAEHETEERARFDAIRYAAEDRAKVAAYNNASEAL